MPKIEGILVAFFTLGALSMPVRAEFITLEHVIVGSPNSPAVEAALADDLPTVYYNPTDGDFGVQFGGPYDIYAIRLESAGAKFTPAGASADPFGGDALSRLTYPRARHTNYTDLTEAAAVAFASSLYGTILIDENELKSLILLDLGAGTMQHGLSVAEVQADLAVDGLTLNRSSWPQGSASLVYLVPEPSPFALLGIGALGLLAYARRKRR